MLWIRGAGIDQPEFRLSRFGKVPAPAGVASASAPASTTTHDVTHLRNDRARISVPSFGPRAPTPSAPRQLTASPPGSPASNNAKVPGPTKPTPVKPGVQPGAAGQETAAMITSSGGDDAAAPDD